MIAEIIILGLLGLASGIGLEIASRKFEGEEESEKIEAVQEVLPGLNCGGCGYAGCEAYSEEVVKNPSKLGSCVQISEEENEKIAEILEGES